MASPLRGTPYAPLARRRGVVAHDSARINIGRPQRMASALLGGALVGFGMDRSASVSVPLLALGGYLTFRGYSGHCHLSDALGIDTSEDDANRFAVVIERSITIARQPNEVYRMWRDVEQLATFMHHVESVTDLGGDRTRWRARIPGGLGTIEWDADVTVDRPGEELAWQSVAHADVDNAGRVVFAAAPGGRGTEVRVRIAYRPPVGRAGSTIASWLNPVLAELVKEDIRRFKHIAEAGEVPTIEGQSSGRD